MLAKHIKNLLEVHNRIIVPDLGAFMTKVDDDQSIYFNEFLRFNDGLLVDYIAQAENIEKIEAARITKIFVDKVKKTLQTEKKYEFEGIGTLVFDENDKKILLPSKSTAFPEEDRDEKTNAAADEIKKTEPEEVLDQKIIPDPILVKEPEKIVTIETPVSLETPSSSESKVRERVIPPPLKEPDTKIEKNKRFTYFTANAIWLIPLILVVLMATDYLIFFRSPSKTSGPITIVSDTAKIEKKIQPVAKDSSGLETTHPEKSVIEPKIHQDNVATAPSTAKLYYLVAGCFKINRNAENFVLQLKKEGYQSEKFAKLGSFHYVSFSSFDKKPPALLEMKKIRAEGKYQTWLIYY
jgi:hypothetical protein